MNGPVWNLRSKDYPELRREIDRRHWGKVVGYVPQGCASDKRKNAQALILHSRRGKAPRVEPVEQITLDWEPDRAKNAADLMRMGFLAHVPDEAIKAEIRRCFPDYKSWDMFRLQRRKLRAKGLL